jgi:hypothetical protein
MGQAEFSDNPGAVTVVWGVVYNFTKSQIYAKKTQRILKKQ